MIKLAVSGCLGRMGQRIAALALTDTAFKVNCLLEYPRHPRLNEEIHGLKIQADPEAIRNSDVLIEFTTPEATLEHLKAAQEYKTKIVIGTTGLTPEHVHEIEKAAKRIAIVCSANMSVGVNITFKLAQLLAQSAPEAYTVKISEAHHIHKKDAPSGTAKTIKNIIEEHSAHRVGDIQSLREGEIVGDHKIIFESPEDTITLEHHAKNRDIFAKGALIAAKFLMKNEKGLFSMQDVLGIK